MSSGKIVLKVANVSKRFGGLQALSDVGITIEQGQVYGLIGPNGAGKTTLINLLTGVLAPTSGRVELLGQDITALNDNRLEVLVIPPDLLDRLKKWRIEHARASDVPAFVIFNDATLHEVARQQPSTARELTAISGIGTVKAQRFGPDLLRLVAEHNDR